LLPEGVEDEKKKNRLDKFGPLPGTEAEEKKKARALKFGAVGDSGVSGDPTKKTKI